MCAFIGAVIYKKERVRSTMSSDSYIRVQLALFYSIGAHWAVEFGKKNWVRNNHLLEAVSMKTTTIIVLSVPVKNKIYSCHQQNQEVQSQKRYCPEQNNEGIQNHDQRNREPLSQETKSQNLVSQNPLESQWVSELSWKVQRWKETFFVITEVCLLDNTVKLYNFSKFFLKIFSIQTFFEEYAVKG